MFLLAAMSLSAEWRAVRLEPAGVSFAGPGYSQRFVLTGTSERGDEWEASRECSVRSSDANVVAIEADAMIAKASGDAVISVSCGAASANEKVHVGSSAGKMEIDFARNVISILTQKGCNSSSCHGSPAGQAGFKLSLYGSDPAADRKMIVEMHGGRRVSLADPEKSLLLKKPSFQVPHGGGHLMTQQSDEYRTMLRWLSEGAKLSAGGPGIQKLEVYPRERILVGKGTSQKLAVIGRMSDGTTVDLAGDVRYAVNDEAVVSAVKDGAVTAKGRGLTVVMARAFGKTATAQMIVIDQTAGTAYRSLAPNNFIDEHVFAKLRQANIEPFPVSNDRTFVRRVFLDAIGVLPTPHEVEAFTADTRADKRARLIDSLLEREEYSMHWLMKFEDWFRNSQYYSQGRTNQSYKRWLGEMIRDDRPYDEAAREMLTATGDTTVRPAGNFWHPAIDFMLKTFEVSKATPTVTRLFLGYRVECAECHNHPLENLTQDDFYGMAAFFGRLKVKHGYGQYRRIWYNAREGEVLHPVTKQPVAPKFLDGTSPQIADGADRREALAEWITRTQKMQFARAAANRIWGEYFGIGIVEPADDFRSTNMPTHPALLDRLATHFIDGGFRFKSLHRLILNSKVYQLSAHTEDRTGGTDPLEKLLFARYEPRKIPAEPLLDAIVQVTGVPHEFGGYPAGTSPKALVASIGMPYFLQTFGFPKRDVMEHRTESPSLSQALHMMNSDTLLKKLAKEDNALGEMLASEPDNARVVERLYLRALSRPPTERQASVISSYLASEIDSGRTRRKAFENVLWTLLNSKEFLLNQ
ncbi:MAG: DUF1549 and DUF1553 domain-containing protein [Bryobacteraceae bacterium]